MHKDLLNKSSSNRKSKPDKANHHDSSTSFVMKMFNKEQQLNESSLSKKLQKEFKYLDNIDPYISALMPNVNRAYISDFYNSSVGKRVIQLKDKKARL